MREKPKMRKLPLLATLRTNRRDLGGFINKVILVKLYKHSPHICTRRAHIFFRLTCACICLADDSDERYLLLPFWKGRARHTLVPLLKEKRVTKNGTSCGYRRSCGYETFYYEKCPATYHMQGIWKGKAFGMGLFKEELNQIIVTYSIRVIRNK